MVARIEEAGNSHERKTGIVPRESGFAKQLPCERTLPTSEAVRRVDEPPPPGVYLRGKGRDE
jgi:hypothetical protein